VVSNRHRSAPFSASDESVQKVALEDDVVVIVDTEEGEENIGVRPFLLLGPSFI
jgi:hypothetical protein